MTKPVAETSTFQYNKRNCRGDSGRPDRKVRGRFKTPVDNGKTE